jgi:hypothetical protein
VSSPKTAGIFAFANSSPSILAEKIKIQIVMIALTTTSKASVNPLSVYQNRLVDEVSEASLAKPNGTTVKPQSVGCWFISRVFL